MKKTIIFALAMFAFSGLVSYLFLYQSMTNKEVNNHIEQQEHGITFILGEDKPGKEYYSLATSFFALDAKEKTEIVHTSCRTLECIITRLNESNQIWSTVNIVAHGNPKTGFNFYIDHEGHKATPKRLLQASILGGTKQLDSLVVDESTKINFWSCGIAQSPLILLALDKLLEANNGVKPNIYCSPKFVVFQRRADSPVPAKVAADFWPYYYKRAYRPSVSEITHEMRLKYRDASIDWAQAIQHETPLNSSEEFTMEYHLPISYTKVFENKSDRPDLSNWEQQLAWMESQVDIMDQLKEIDIPLEKFDWKVRKIIHTTKDGTRVPAVKALGMCTVLCFLQ